MGQLDADALEREGWSLCRTFQKDKDTMVYEVKKPSDFPTIEERKTGKWEMLQIPISPPVYKCSVCGSHALPPAQPDIIRCRDCKHWNQATAYHGGALSFGFCESDAMWRSLYGETTEIAHIDTDDDFFCGYAERREE